MVVSKCEVLFGDFHPHAPAVVALLAPDRNRQYDSEEVPPRFIGGFPENAQRWLVERSLRALGYGNIEVGIRPIE